MTSPSPSTTTAAIAGKPRSEASDGGAIPSHELRWGLELHFFAHLNLAEDADRQLRGLELGRTHHRILYFVARRPGITVGQLLTILRVTHQNIQRALAGLIRDGFIEQRTAPEDRRQRQLFVTDKGRSLFERLSERQFSRILAAYEAAGPEAVRGYWRVLWHMMEDSDRALMASGPAPFDGEGLAEED